MKRSEPLRRTEPLKRSEPPQRAEALKRSAIRRKRRRQSPHEAEAAARWHRGIMGLTCVRCRRKPATDAHHIIREQVLKREAFRRGFVFELMRWHVDNRLALCRQCHEDHHHGKPISRELLWRCAPRVFAFARRLHIEHVLEREYPDTNPKGATAP